VTIHGVLRDVTRERLAEEAILAAMAEAEAASQAKGDFLANMSHEIRTPMNAIIGLSGLALKQEMPARIQDYLLKIKKSGEHLLGIINDILDFSKIEAGKMEVEAIAFELNAVVENVVNLISEKVQSKGLELICSLAPDLPRVVVGDPLRIGQIFINYASNAVKFTQTGEVRLGVEMEHIDDDSVLIRFTVSDTGIGMTQAQMERLFKSFEQGDTSITRQYGGTGLGLAICKYLALLMGGSVGVDSVYGSGSTFWFSARLGIGSRERLVSRLSVDLYGCNVLVVDDNAASVTVLSSTLSELGFTVQTAGGGRLALQMLQQSDASGTPFELLLIDWMMPGMDGLETVRALQELPLRTHPLVLMLSAHRPGELVTQAEQLGIRHVLAKPVNSSLLVNTLMQMMGAQAPDAAAPRVSRQSAKEAELQALTGARILLVEDNDINQQVACELLRSVGFEVEVADNGQRAIQSVAASVAQNLGFDLVLMDIQMPVMDGVTATRLLRETYTAQVLPVVAMTANVMQADRERCLEAGMNGFVSKPINPDDLWTALLCWIKPRPGLGPTASTPPQRGNAPNLSAAAQEALQVLAPLRQHDVLDLDQGLRLTSNNPVLYLQLLRRFLVSQADAAHAVAAALERNEFETAKRLAHTLKGVSGNLGARAVFQSADQLEQSLRAGLALPELTVALDALQIRLQALTAVMQAVPGLVLQTSPAPATRAPLDAVQQAAAAAALQGLRQLLQDDNAQAQTQWQEQSALVWSLLQEPEALGEAIMEFDFERALQLLPVG
jgi:CheY-like chemotaxis protein